ncbi:TlpA disulfide reductase family protein [Granulicella sp. WH15]|uniref:TlpA disulfide reductase family protein n=1 Tax=Granulicella sp. WH15 TaxID=2602070 RepID=UPI0013A5411B|nr:TlpA disulfide reductase family protein [Granulicella sp. WH15]
MSIHSALKLSSALALLLALTHTSGAQTPVFAGPTDPRAIQAYQEATEFEKHRNVVFALDNYRKADKLDGNKCAACALAVVKVAVEIGDFKAADAASQELIALSTTPEQQTKAHLSRAQMLLAMGQNKKKPECFQQGAAETDLVLATKPNDATALYLKGTCLAFEQHDDDARKVFGQLTTEMKPGSVDYTRITRFAERPELARARMAPAFRVTTLDGKRVSLDELKNKVVLIDFWATWCGPCREALPHMQQIAKKFEGQPLVILSISLDKDEQKWKEFVGKNNMTWLQYRDNGFNGSIATSFGVQSIPHTFTIDSDGVLQDEKIGDGYIEGKLKKLIAQAVQNEAKQREAAAPVASGTTASQQ